MATHAANVYDVTDADFEQAVIARSAEVPVLVDFWAPWCGPCHRLGPVLEKLAREMAGAFVLAKVDTDQNPAAATRYQVRGIPHVSLFVNGAVAGQFVGALPEEQVRAFLSQHCPSPVDALITEGRQHLARGDQAAARDAFERALAMAPESTAAHLALARLALRRRDLQAVDAHLGHIPPLAGEHEAGEHVRQAAALVREVAGDRQAVQARVAAAPDDLEARFALGVHLLADGQYREALEALVGVAEQDRKWRDEAARKAMLTVFGLVGVRDPLSNEYRRKLMFIY